MAPDQTNLSPLQALISDHKHGQNSGIFSICSAHQAVLETCFQNALESGKSLLIAATCHHVDPVADAARSRNTTPPLDTTMPCAEEVAGGRLEPELIASRTAALCLAAETAY